VLIAQPVQLTAGAPANLWLVAGVTEMRAARVRTVGQALGIATWALVAHLAGVALDLARRDRDHHLVLSRLLDEADRPSLQILEQATALGWRLTGWHTAVRITTRRVGAALPPASIGVLLHRHLAANGILAVPLSGEDDWTVWTSETTPPHDQDAVRAAVRRALLAAERELPGIRLCAGVGAASEGLPGLRESLTQAREASLLASTRATPCPVERLGRDSVNRILVAHHAAGPQHQLALHLLRPLIDADPSGQLVHTLACYLDHESSATAAAGALGVHRNTVLQRLDRIRVLLDADLSDVDQRLALHLAARLARMGDREAAELGHVG
jgi:sugar diacid utilization regulator